MPSRKNLFFRLSLVFLLVGCLTGCLPRRELNTIAIVSGVSIDKGKDANIQLTAQIIKITKKEEGGSIKSSFFVIKSSGNTVFDAIQKFSRISNRKLFWAHSEVIIFGQELVESEGITKYFNFFVNNPEMRPSVFLMIAKGEGAKILEAKSEHEQLSSHHIAELFRKQSVRAGTIEIIANNFLKKLPSKTMAQIIPFIEKTPLKSQELKMIGIAVMKKDKFVGKLNAKESRGAGFIIKKKVGDAIITVPCPHDKGNVSLEIVQFNKKIIPKIKDKQLSMNLKFTVKADINEQTCAEDFSEPEGWYSLRDAVSDEIKSDVQAAITKAKVLNADIFGFGEAYHKKYSRKWKNYEEEWDKIFPELKVSIEAKTDFRISGLLSKPLLKE